VGRERVPAKLAVTSAPTVRLEEKAVTERVAEGGRLESWVVFVRLRDRPGTYERSIRASGPIDAEQAVSVADRGVLETLGAQLVRDGHRPANRFAYRPLQQIGPRYLKLRRKGRPDMVGPATVAVVEVMTPEANP
jgi:hypothetical protein